MEITIYQNINGGFSPDSNSLLPNNSNMCYLLSERKQDGVCTLVDASVVTEQIANDIKQRRLRLDNILITHSHQNQIDGIAELAKNFPETKIGIHRSSIYKLTSLPLTNLFPLENDTIIRIGKETLSVVHTPGHTWDSVSFWDKNNALFYSGDTILGGGIGHCDYQNGGNRNTFYYTLKRLVNILPSDTLIYPGHLSDRCRIPLPYKLSADKIENPYISCILQGKRYNFDRILKSLSSEFEICESILMGKSDLNKILALERDIWIPDLQASEEKFKGRLNHNHKILAIKRNNILLGMIGWRYSKFSAEDPKEHFPLNFSDFSTSQPCDEINPSSAFIYSVGVKPSLRKNGIGSLLLQYTIDKIREDNISQIFIDSRLPSYNGSHQSKQEDIKQDFKFKEILDGYFLNNKFPTEKEFATDSTIRFYIRNGFKPWSIKRNFISHDYASGNMRVICYMNLKNI